VLGKRYSNAEEQLDYIDEEEKAVIPSHLLLPQMKQNQSQWKIFQRRRSKY
jgi:hypothetical protein